MRSANFAAGGYSKSRLDCSSRLSRIKLRDMNFLRTIPEFAFLLHLPDQIRGAHVIFLLRDDPGIQILFKQRSLFLQRHSLVGAG